MSGHLHIGSRQAKHLAKTCVRRHKTRAALVLSRLPKASARTEAKAEAREKCLDQITLDKLQGLESGEICREHYKKLPQRPPPQRQRRKHEMRSDDTYRAARRNAERGPRRSLALKAERQRTGETRSQVDRHRKAAQQQEPPVRESRALEGVGT